MLLRFASLATPALTTSINENGSAALALRGWRAEGLRAGPEDDGRQGGGGSKFESGAATKVRSKTKRPSLYRVLLLNDDYTPMEFVVLVLQDVFNKSREEAMRIMLHVHNQGIGECGIYPFEVAETKVTRVMDTARKNQHPLQCVMEKQ